MNNETKESIALEITKLKILNNQNTEQDHLSAELWVKTFNESLLEVENTSKASENARSVRMHGLL